MDLTWHISRIFSKLFGILDEYFRSSSVIEPKKLDNDIFSEISVKSIYPCEYRILTLLFIEILFQFSSNFHIYSGNLWKVFDMNQRTKFLLFISRFNGEKLTLICDNKFSHHKIVSLSDISTLAKYFYRTSTHLVSSKSVL